MLNRRVAKVYEGIVVECDRCHRPAGQLVHRVDALGERVVLEGPRVGADSNPYWHSVMASGRGPRYVAAQQGPTAGRGGAYVLGSPTPAQPYGRDKIVCIGRKHPRYERTVTEASITATYHWALAAGRGRVAMSEIRA